MNIKEKRDIEKKKYIYLNNFTWGDGKQYGESFHGKKTLKAFDFKQYDIKTILDVGTGRGQAVHYMNNINLEAKGVDFAIKPNAAYDQKMFFTSPAHELPFEDKSFDCITCFDVLEHCITEEIELILREFHRVAKKLFIFSISFGPSKIYTPLVEKNMNGQLHQTVKPWKWWESKIQKHGEVHKRNGGITCLLKK